MEKHNSGIKHGFCGLTRIVGLPSKKPPPKTAKKWAMTAEMASLSTVPDRETEQEVEEDSELTGLNFHE